jgi:hypothetical protein
MPTRVKSDEEYNKLLGIDEEVTINSAQEFFSKQQKNKEKTNPFDNTMSIEDIKKQLREKEVGSIEEIKKEIAQAQSNMTSDEVVVSEPVSKRKFSFEENARQLYENLRASSLNSHVFSRPSEVQETAKDAIKPSEVIDDEPKDMQLENSAIEPTQQEPIKIIEENIKEDKDVNGSAITPLLEDVDPLTLIDDFDEENNSFLEAIDDKNDLSELQSNIASLEKDAINDDLTDIETSGNTAILDELDSQMASLNDVNDEVMVLPEIEPEVIPEINDAVVKTKDENDIASSLDALFSDTPKELELNTPQAETPLDLTDVSKDESSDIAKQLEQLNILSTPKNDKEKDFNNTLSLALDKEKSLSFTDNELGYLKDDDDTDIIKTKKSKTFDILLTIFLVIMICIVGFLVAKTFFFN